MKRSEFIKKVYDKFYYIAYERFVLSESDISDILDYMEELGMLPPKGLFKNIDKNEDDYYLRKWEPE